MVSIIREQQERRAQQISAIQASIDKMIKNKENIDINNIVIATMAHLNLSRKTALDYVYVAFYNLGIDNIGKKKKDTKLFS